MNILDVITRETNLSFAKQTASEYAGPCPFCGEGDNRFRVWPIGEKPRYWCRICNAKGDSIQFVRDYKHLEYREACEYLNIEIGNHSIGSNSIHHNNHNHLIHHNHHNHHNAEPQTLSLPSEDWMAQAWPFVIRCQAALWEPGGERALAWLRGRGLADDVIMAAGLGYNAADTYVPRAAWGLPPETTKQGKTKGLWLPRGVTIPWIINNDLWGVRIRRPVGDPPYYFIPGGQASGLYNADRLVTGRPAILLEGELDALTVWQNGYIAVATGSTNTARRARWLARLALASTVLVAYDNDENGAGDIGAEYWTGALKNAKRWRPYWKDANQMQQDGVNIAAWVKAGLGDMLPCDLTDYIGQTITPYEWQCLQKHAGALGWSVDARPEGEDFHVYRLFAPAAADDE